jgi:CheY-like chemotaxis protein
LLTHRGLDVAFVTSGAEALEFMRSQPVKVLLLDLMMPGMTGFEVLRSMQDDKQARDLPVVIYSASADPETRQQAQTLGAQAFVAKGSTTFDDLHAVISSFVTGGHSPGGTTLAN